MSTPRSRSTAPVVVVTLAPLRDGPAGRLDVRVIEVRRGERRLDVRQYVASDTFNGYTRRGVCLTAEEFDALLEQRDQILAVLEGRPAPAGDRARRAT